MFITHTQLDIDNSERVNSEVSFPSFFKITMSHGTHGSDKEQGTLTSQIRGHYHRLGGVGEPVPPWYLDINKSKSVDLHQLRKRTSYFGWR